MTLEQKSLDQLVPLPAGWRHHGAAWDDVRWQRPTAETGSTPARPARPLACSPEQALPAQQDNGWVCGDDDDFDATHSAISRSSEAQQPPIPS